MCFQYSESTFPCISIRPIGARMYKNILGVKINYSSFIYLGHNDMLP